MSHVADLGPSADIGVCTEPGCKGCGRGVRLELHGLCSECARVAVALFLTRDPMALPPKRVLPAAEPLPWLREVAGRA